VIESRLDIGRGPIATVLVQRGTLRAGVALVAGDAWGQGGAHSRTITAARPRRRVRPSRSRCSGSIIPPPAGERFRVVESERVARPGGRSSAPSACARSSSRAARSRSRWSSCSRRSRRVAPASSTSSSRPTYRARSRQAIGEVEKIKHSEVSVARDPHGRRRHRRVRRDAGGKPPRRSSSASTCGRTPRPRQRPSARASTCAPTA